MKKEHLILIGIILIAFTLRLTRLGEQSLWYDEGVTWMLSQMPLPELIEWTAADIQPPLYYLLIWTTDIIFGDTEWALRFPSVIFSVLTVPLIYALARRLFYNQPLSSLLAALLFALSPLMVYYSQEARMYTLLVFEATLISYLLLKVLHPKATEANFSPRRVPMAAIGYAVVGAAALYTHYFAAFLLTAHALYAFITLSFNRSRAIGNYIRPLFVCFGGSLLLFVPWLPTLIARLGDDPSYWPGALKLNEALRKVLISFTVGETVLEQTGWQLSLLFLALLLLCFIAWLFIQRSTTPNDSTLNAKVKPAASRLTGSWYLFLLLWLLLPITLILALSYQSPKFNPRYTLLAWPAFALLIAAIVGNLLNPKPTLRTTHHARRLTYASFTLSLLTILFLLSAGAFSLTNWFTNRNFMKDDFQALAQFVRERKAPDETVLLSSGHLFPVWAYYYGWEGWTPLPWMLRLDVNRVTSLDIAGQIEEAIAGYEGVWLVSWQDEVIDPNGVVPFWLDLIGERPNDAGDFWGVGLEHWRLDPTDVKKLGEDPIQHPAAINFADKIDLLGYTQLSDNEIVLFWRPRQTLPDTLSLTLELTDSDGFIWSRAPITGLPGAYFYPPSRWPVGQIIPTRYRLPWQIGAPPGLYIAKIGLGEAGRSAGNAPTAAKATPTFSGWDVLDEQGRPLRRTALLDFVNLSQLVEPDDGPLPQDQDPVVDYFPIIGLRRTILPQDTAQPGDQILLALLWQAGEFNLDDISIAFDLVDAEGQTFRVGSSLTPSRQFNLPRWKPGDLVLGQYWLNIPPEAAPGPAILQVHLVNVSGYQYDEVFPFDNLEILPTERNFELPEAVDMPLEANFSNQATLIGADCAANCRAAPGESLTLTLYWRAEAPFETGYTVFVHVLDEAETVLINADHAPPKPTQGWIPAEIITDPVDLAIPADLPSGEYMIEVGLYNAADPEFQRLALTNGATRVILPTPLRIAP